MKPTSNQIVRKPLNHTHCHLICYVYIKGCVSICGNTHCLMLEVLRYIAYIALNAFNCVHTKIKAMSKVSKICHRFQCIKCYVCWRCRRWCLQLLHNTAYGVTHFVSLHICSMWETTVMHKQVSGWTVNFGPNFPDQSLLRNTPPFRKTSDLGWPKFTPEYPPNENCQRVQVRDFQNTDSYYMWRLYPTRITTSYSCWRCWRCQIIWIIDQRLKIHTNLFLLISSLIFNGFSIWKKFWKAET